MSDTEKEILAFEENLVKVRDFDEKVDLLILNSLERFGYLKSARDAKVPFVFYLHEENDKNYDNWVKFSSYLFIDEEESIEIEINKKFYKNFKNPFVWGTCMLNNVKIVFESRVKEVLKEERGIYSISISLPNRMIRYQRRESFRVKIPPFSKLSVDLEPNPKLLDYQSLPIVNLSIGGAAILFNTNQDIAEMPRSFENATLYLDGKSFHGIKVRVCRINNFSNGAIPLNIASKKTGLHWYEVGLSFERLPYKVEQELFIIVNNMSKKF